MKKNTSELGFKDLKLRVFQIRGLILKVFISSLEVELLPKNFG